MNSKNSLHYTAYFLSEAKRFYKKFPSLRHDFEHLAAQLLDKPETGTSLGAGLYKIRLGTASKGGGKSGGFRVITYLLHPIDTGTEVYFITIYDKSEEENIDRKILLKLVEKHVGP